MSVKINIGVTYNGKNIRKSFQDLSRLRREADTTSGKMKALGAQMQLVGRSMSNVGRTMTRRVSTPLALVGGMAVKTAADFETSFAKIEGLVGVASDEIGELQEAARRLGPEMGKSGTEAAEALFFITSAGLRGAEAIETLEASLRASAVGLGETAVVADLVTSSVNAYGSAALSATEATDILTNAVRLGKLQPEDLAGAIGQVLPLASAMGVEFHEVGAAFAAMSRTGTNANIAATQLSRILAQLLSVTPEAADALESVGLSAEGIRRQLREEGLLSVLDTLVNSFDNNAAATEAVFGNIRALRGVVDLMGSNVEATREIFDGMTDSTGVLNEAFAITADTGAFKFRQAVAELNDAMISLGQDLLPVAMRIVDAVQGIVEKFTNLSPAMQDTLLKIAGIVALAGPMMMFVGNLLSGIGLLTIAMGKFGVATALATGGLSLLFGAIGLVILHSTSLSDEQERLRRKTRDNRIEQEKLAGAYGAQAQAAAEAREQRRRDAAAARLEGQAAYFAGGGFDYLAAAKEDAANSAEDAVDPLAEVEAALAELSETAGGAAAPAVVALTDDMRTALQDINLLAAGMDNGGEFVAQFARELLAAGQITDEVSAAAVRLAQVVKQDIDRSLSDANRRLDDATRKFEAYRDAIAEGITQGNTLGDAANAQAAAIQRVAEAEEAYQQALAGEDPDRIAEAADALEDAKDEQKSFLDFLQVGLTTAEGFAGQIDALRLAGASMSVVQQIAELGARTGGRIAAELLAGGAAAIEQANELVAAVENASRRAGEAAAQQFHGAGVEAARQFVSAVEASIPALQGVLDRIADMIEAALGTRPDVVVDGTERFIPPPSAPGGARNAAGNVPFVPDPTAPLPTLPGGLRYGEGGLPFIPGLATGGLVTSPTLALIGEAGPEMVVPLDRMGDVGGGKTIVNVTVTSADPNAVVEAIRRFTRQNGPLGSSVKL